jgi:hypothetical protein
LRTSRRGPDPGRTTLREDAFVLLGFLLLSALYTYPLFFLREGQLYGLQDDVARALNDFWAIGRDRNWLALHRHRYDLNAPEGVPFMPTPQFLYWWSVAFLSGLVGLLRSTNVLVAVSFPLSAYFMYRMALEVTRSRTASVLAGFLFAFGPWHQSKAEAFVEMASIQWVPLYGWCLLRYVRNPGTGTALAASGSFVLLFNFSYVLGAMSALFAAVILSLWHGVRLRQGRLPGPGALGALLIGHLLALSGWAWNRVLLGPDPDVPWNPLARVVDEASLRMGTVDPVYFLLPPYWHPLWGDGVRDLLLRLKPGGYLLDDVVNPGYVVWVLFLAGVVRWWRDRNAKGRPLHLLFAGAALAAALLCLDPQQGGRWLPLPNVFLYRAFPAFRVFSRFALLFAFFATLVAVGGWARLTGSWSVRARVGATVLLLFLAGFELYRPMGGQVLDQRRVPEAYRWLRGQSGDGIVAEYPIVTRNIPFEPAYLFWQIHHGKPLLNADRPGSPGAGFRRRVADLGSPETPEALRVRGVRYVVVHGYHYVADRFPGLDPRAGNVKPPIPDRLPGARKVGEWDGTALFEFEDGR